MSSNHATGHVRVIERKGGPVAYAKLKLPDGTEPQRKLGRLWTKRSAPPAGYITRGQAQARLEAILAGDDPLVNVSPSHVTFQAACDERIRYLEHDKQRKRSTLIDYRNVIDHDLLPHFGADTPVENIATIDVEAFKDKLLARVSHRTAQKVLVILYGVMVRAKRKGWISVNPCEDAEKVTVQRSDDFNVVGHLPTDVTRHAPEAHRSRAEESVEHWRERLRIDHVRLAFGDRAFCPRHTGGDRVRRLLEELVSAARGHQGRPDLRQAAVGGWPLLRFLLEWAGEQGLRRQLV
jgi:hypothetical protein